MFSVFCFCCSAVSRFSWLGLLLRPALYVSVRLARMLMFLPAQGSDLCELMEGKKNGTLFWFRLQLRSDCSPPVFHHCWCVLSFYLSGRYVKIRCRILASSCCFFFLRLIRDGELESSHIINQCEQQRRIVGVLWKITGEVWTFRLKFTVHFN